jgi:hypothetical protein
LGDKQQVTTVNSPSIAAHSGGARTLLASAIIVLLFALSAVGSALRKPVTEGFDEVAHLSYVAHLQEHPAWPRLEQMRLLEPATFAVTSEANYLNHPPFYYALLAALSPQIVGHPASLLHVRLLNVAIGVLGLIALLRLASRMKLQGLAFYAFAIMIAATPVLAPLAGSVNNDNLGFAGGALGILGAYEYVLSRQRHWLIVAVLGMLIASASKLTGLLLSGGFLGALLALQIMTRTTRKSDIAIIGAGLLVAAAPYIAFTLQYGNPAPNTPAQLDLLTNGARTAGWATAPRLGAFAYGWMFVSSFLSQWMPSLQPRNVFQTVLLVLPASMVALCAAGATISLRRIIGSKGTSTDLVVVAGMLATIATLGVHIVFSYQRHLMSGWMMDAYPRYYLPVIAVIAMAAIVAAEAAPSPRMRTVLLAYLAIAPLIFGVFGAPLG